MAHFFIILTTLFTLAYQPFTQAQETDDTAYAERKAQPAPAQAPSSGAVQYVYIPYVVGQPMPPLPQQPPSTDPNAPQIQYVYVPYTPGQQPTVPAQQAASQQKPSHDGPNVAEVMTTFAGVLGGIVAMGMGAEYDNPEQEAQGLNMFIQNGAQLISILTRSPYTEEQFELLFIRSVRHLTRSRRIAEAA